MRTENSFWRVTALGSCWSFFFGGGRGGRTRRRERVETKGVRRGSQPRSIAPCCSFFFFLRSLSFWLFLCWLLRRATEMAQRPLLTTRARRRACRAAARTARGRAAPRWAATSRAGTPTRGTPGGRGARRGASFVAAGLPRPHWLLRTTEQTTRASAPPPRATKSKALPSISRLESTSEKKK